MSRVGKESKHSVLKVGAKVVCTHGEGKQKLKYEGVVTEIYPHRVTILMEGGASRDISPQDFMIDVVSA